MPDDLFTIRRKFDSLLRSVKGSPTAEFTKMVEMSFEALVCVTAISEYARLLGQPLSVINPVRFLNQKPGRFSPSRAFEVRFPSGTYFFATDVECLGLAAFKHKSPVGDIFEADVVVIKEEYLNEIINDFDGYPAPQHIDAAYECKFGKYQKSQLRELLGLRRHLSYVNPGDHVPPTDVPFGKRTTQANPNIQVIMFRSTKADFLQTHTAELYDLHQVVL